MSAWTILFARSARKELEALSLPLAERILRRIENLSLDQRPAGSRKLRGENPYWRLRVGEYRVIDDIDDRRKEIVVVLIRHRKDAYR